MRVALYAGVAATLLIGIGVPVRAQSASQPQIQDSEKLALIHQLLTTTHAVDLAVSTIENSISAQRTANPRVPAVFWDRFLAETRNRRGEFEAMVVPVYDRHYSSAELRQLIAFYQSPIGQKVIAELPAVTQESMDAGRQWGMKVGTSIAEQLKSEGVQLGP
jgi:uncharacterized protein